MKITSDGSGTHDSRALQLAPESRNATSPDPDTPPINDGGPSRKKKRKRPRVDDKSSDEVDCVKTSTVTVEVNKSKRYVPRYLVVKLKEEGKSFKEMSPFFIAKTVNGICSSPVTGCRKLADGSLLISADPRQSLALSRCVSFGGLPVSVEPHKELNTSKGVIFCWDLAFVSEEECVTEMKSQGVLACRKLTSRNQKQSASMVLTFDGDKLPERVYVGYNVCSVRAYVPNPLRCYNCHRFGHSSGRCKKQTTCGNCGQGKHDVDPCPNKSYCVNCKGDHPASSRSCTVFLDEKAINTIKVKNKCTYIDAKKEYRRLAPVTFSRSFATVAAKPAQKFNAGTQTEVCITATQSIVAANKTTEVEKPATQAAIPRTQELGNLSSSSTPPTPKGPTTPKPLPPTQEIARKRISPVRTPRNIPSAVREDARKRASSVSSPRKPPGARNGKSALTAGIERPASVGSGTFREPSEWIRVERRRKPSPKTKLTAAKPVDSMDVDPQPSTSGVSLVAVVSDPPIT